MPSISSPTPRASVSGPRGRLVVLGAAFGLADVAATVERLVDATTNPHTLEVRASADVLGHASAAGPRTLTVVYRYDDGPAQVAVAKEGFVLAIRGPLAAGDAGRRGAAAADEGRTLVVHGCTYGPADVTARVRELAGEGRCLSFVAGNARFTDTWPGVPKTFAIVYGVDGVPVTLAVGEDTAVSIAHQPFTAIAVDTCAGSGFVLDTSGKVWRSAPRGWTQVGALDKVSGMSFGAGGNLWCVVGGEIWLSRDFGATFEPTGGAGVVQVSASADGDAWALTAQGRLSRWETASRTWRPQPEGPPVPLVQIAVACGDVQWGLDAAGGLQRRCPADQWHAVPSASSSPIASMSVTNEGIPFAVAEDGVARVLLDGPDGTWQPIVGAVPALRAVSARDLGVLWGLTRGGDTVSLFVLPPPGLAVPPSGRRPPRPRDGGGLGAPSA